MLTRLLRLPPDWPVLTFLVSLFLVSHTPFSLDLGKMDPLVIGKLIQDQSWPLLRL